MKAVALIIYGEDAAAEPVVHRFFTDKVAFAYGFTVMFVWQQAIFHQFASAFVFLIVAISFGVVQTYVYIPGGSEVVVEKQLVVLLYVVVRLVFIEMVGAVVVGVHISARVITAAVFLHFFFTGIIPGMVGTLFAAKCY